MALGFFRRRQKMVMIIMVMLMVAFLIPTGIRGCFERTRGSLAVGRMGTKDITLAMEESAGNDLRILSMLFQDDVQRLAYLRRLLEGDQLLPWAVLAEQASRMRVPFRGDQDWLAFIHGTPEKDQALNWALLVEEARKMGVKVTGQEIDAELGRIQDLPQFLTVLARSSLGKGNLRGALEDYWLVTRALREAVGQTPPSMRQLEQWAHDHGDRLKSALAVFSGKDYLNDSQLSPERLREYAEQYPDKMDKELKGKIDKQFAEYKDRLPTEAKENDFPFGYRQGNRVEIAWMLVDESRLGLVVEPTEDEITAEWNSGREVTREIPATPVAPARSVRVTDFAQAEPIIRQKLKERQLKSRMDAIVKGIRQQLQQLGDDPEAYEKVRDSLLTVDSKEHPLALLGKPAPRIPYKSAHLSDVIRFLENKSGVKIVYPFNPSDSSLAASQPASQPGTQPGSQPASQSSSQPGSYSLSGELTVAVEPGWEKLTLGEVLERIQLQFKQPAIKWAVFKPLDNALFPTAPANLTPIAGGATKLVDVGALDQIEPLNATHLSTDPSKPEYAQGVRSLAETVFAPAQKNRELRLDAHGDCEQVMYVASGKYGGQLLWRLKQQKPAETLEKPTPEIIPQIVKDIFAKEGFERAKAEAENLKVRLDAIGPSANLTSVVPAGKVIETGEFSRMGYATQDVPEAAQEILASGEFVKRAFDNLEPKNVEPPYPDKPSIVVALPRLDKVVLVQRTGFVPITQQEFTFMAPYWAQAFRHQQRWAAVESWYADVQRRVGYQPKNSSQE